MLQYAQIQLEDNSYYRGCHDSIKLINASSARYKEMGIYMDEIGMAVVILSNLSPNYKIPATVLGIKLLSEI